MRRVGVFCGARIGDDPRFRDAAAAVGTGLAKGGIGLVYGGGSRGLMGVLADATLAAGGEVDGVMPASMAERERAHRGLTRLHVVPDLSTRKARMAELSDGFIALPGGLGTLDELFEMLTWTQLGVHAKPIALLDVAGYYADLVRFLDGAVARGFVGERTRARLAVATSAEAAIATSTSRELAADAPSGG